MRDGVVGRRRTATRELEVQQSRTPVSSSSSSLERHEKKEPVASRSPVIGVSEA